MTGPPRLEPIRPFTERQRSIAAGIDRGQSYAEIGFELHISEHTVRQHVRAMALLLDEPRDLPPRWRILFWVRQQQWEQRHQAALLKKPA